MSCRVCGFPQDEPIWGHDGQSPTYGICACCGCEFGYEDCLPEAIGRHRDEWLASGVWFNATKRPENWNKEDQLRKLARFHFRVLPGLPGTGSPPVPFNLTGTPIHSEGFVVEFTGATGKTWVGNFRVGLGGASGVMVVLGRTDQALVLARGQAYVVEPETCALVRTCGGQITEAFVMPDREAIVLGNGLWFECLAPNGLRWRTRRISWDGMVKVSLCGETLGGQAFNPVGDTWMPFEVDIDTGDVRGGSYPPELPQP